LGRAPRVCRSNGGVAPVIAGGLLQGRPQDPPGNGFRYTFFVTKASFVTPRFLPLGSDGSERRQVVVHLPRGRYLGLAAIPEDLARRGYCAPLPAGRRGGGPSVAMRRSESRGGSGTQRRQRHAQRCNDGSRSLIRSPMSETNLRAGLPRPKAGLEPLQQT
jgi:hypothetical protein